MRKYFKYILLFVFVLLSCVFLYFFYKNKNIEPKKNVYEQTPKKNEISKEEINTKIELIYFENKEYINSLNNDNAIISSFLIKKVKEELPGGVSAAEIRDNVIIFLDNLNQ